MTDLAARLAQRARPLGEGPVMVPYRPDRPADPRIGPESPLADFGGHGDAEAIGADAATEVGAEAPMFDSVRLTPEITPMLRGHESLASDAAMAAPMVEPSADASENAHIDIGPGRANSPVIVHEHIVHHTDHIERRVERVHHPSTHPITGIEVTTTDARPPLAPPERSLEVRTRPSAEARTATPFLAPTPHPRLDAHLDERPSRPSDSRDSDSDSAPPSTGQPTKRASFDSPTPTPTPAALRPRERPFVFDEPLVEPVAPTIHIGSITVEVVPSPARAEARRVQTPPERPQRPAAATTSSARSSRPLRTFGLRQL